MKITRGTTESVATVLGRIKSIYVSIYWIRFPNLDQMSIYRKCECHALSCLHRLISTESNNLFNQYHKVVLAEGDVMTTALASSFIATSEATTAKNRIMETKYLPPQMSNLDLHSFDVSNPSEIVVSSTKFQNKETFQRTSRSRDASDIRSSDRRQRSQERGRQYTKGSSPGRDKARPE